MHTEIKRETESRITIYIHYLKKKKKKKKKGGR